MAGSGEWNETLCGCCDDCKICLCGSFCVPCLFGQNAEKIDGSSCCLKCCEYTVLEFCCLYWVPHYNKRRVLRQKYGLREEPCSDCPVTFCCGPCALCQEARFLERKVQYPVVVIGAVVPSAGPIINQPHGNF